jgi:hypothetical protein
MERDLNAPIGIVSIFGRGHWLAAKLAQSKVPVTLLDISQQMGTWMPEDLEGPFGYFQMQDLQEERLAEDEKNLKIPGGFTIWLPDGPVELHGPTHPYRLKQMQMPEEGFEYLQKSSSLTPAQSAALKKLSFEKTWLLQMAHYFTGSVETLSVEAVKEGLKRNLLEDFFIRQVSPGGHAKSLNWCEEKGVKVLRNVELKDLVLEEGRKIASLEVRIDHPGIFKAEQVVLCLTSEECAMISQKIQQSLFANALVEPQWAWLRYRIHFQGAGPLSALTRDQIPAHCLVIGDLDLPWTHENLIVLQRVPAQNGSFDLWMKIPNNQRFNSQYLAARGEKAKDVLEARLPDNQVVITHLPNEAKTTFQHVGPARHPVFSRAVISLRSRKNVGNIYFDSPEYWRALSWEGQFEHQASIFQELKAWWDHKEEMRIKRELKEAVKQKHRGADL